MSLQEQLAQSQKPTVSPYFPVFEASFEAGLLAQSTQAPTNIAGAEPFAQDARAQQAEVPCGLANAESPEMDWLVQEAQELARYKGEWLLIQGRHLLVHSRDFAVVRAAVRERQLQSPFVYYVPTDEESAFVTI